MRQLDSANAPRWEWRTFGVRLSDIEANWTSRADCAAAK